MGVTALGLLMIGLLNCVILAQKKSKIPFLFPVSVCSGSWVPTVRQGLGIARGLRQSWVP